MTPMKGRTPKTEGPFMVQFRSGWISGPFKRHQIRWNDTGDSFDVLAAQPTQDTDHHTQPPREAV